LVIIHSNQMCKFAGGLTCDTADMHNVIQSAFQVSRPPTSDVGSRCDTTVAVIRGIFTSTDASTGVLDIKIQADSVHSGRESKDNKLKEKNASM